MSTIFVSPCLFEETYGGVQLSGQLALNALGMGELVQEARVLCYGPQCTRRKCVDGGDDRCSHSKPGAVLRALSLRGRAARVLFWHLDLLRLLPLIGHDEAKIYLFLHGVECWQSADARTQHLLARVDSFLTNSDYTWARFVEKNPPWNGCAHRTVALGLGLPEQNVSPPAPVPAAVIIGRMYRSENYKGHRELIDAWPSVLRSMSEAELWILGGGDAVDDLKQMAAARGVGRQVRFFGVVSEEKKQILLQSARCLVLPSRGEGFGLAYLEAMRLGRPCLASTKDAGREVVNPPEAGLAVDPADIEGIAAAVVRLLSPSPEWQGWSVRAKNRWESFFTATHYQRRLRQAVLEEEVC